MDSSPTSRWRLRNSAWREETVFDRKTGIISDQQGGILSDSKGFIRSGRRWEMHFPRFGTERSLVRIQSPRSMKSVNYGHLAMPVLLLRSRRESRWLLTAHSQIKPGL